MNKTEEAIDQRRALVPHDVVRKYVSLCTLCNKNCKSSLISTIIPIESKKTWERAQIDLVDMRHKPDTVGNKKFKYICHVIDHFSSFNVIWAMEQKSAAEVVQGIFDLIILK